MEPVFHIHQEMVHLIMLSIMVGMFHTIIYNLIFLLTFGEGLLKRFFAIYNYRYMVVYCYGLFLLRNHLIVSYIAYCSFHKLFRCWLAELVELLANNSNDYVYHFHFCLSYVDILRIQRRP